MCSVIVNNFPSSRCILTFHVFFFHSHFGKRWKDSSFSFDDFEWQQLYCRHKYQVTKHVLLSTYANSQVFAFLLKPLSILKVSKLFYFNRNKVGYKQSLLHQRPKGSTHLGFIVWSLERDRKRSSGQAKCQRHCHPWQTCTRIAALWQMYLQAI